MLIGLDLYNKYRPYFFTTTSFVITHNNQRYSIPLINRLSYSLTMAIINNKIQKWIDEEKKKYSSEIQVIEARIKKNCFDDPQAFWDKEQFLITLPALPINAPTRATHPGMIEEDTEICRKEIAELLEKDLIEPSSSNWACLAFYVNKHNEQKRGKKRLVINNKPLNQFLIPLRYPLPLITKLI